MSPDNIKEIRKALKLTQQKLADLIGARQHTVARWETGLHKPTGAYLKALMGLSKRAMRKRSRRKGE